LATFSVFLKLNILSSSNLQWYQSLAVFLGKCSDIDVYIRLLFTADLGLLMDCYVLREYLGSIFWTKRSDSL